MWSYDFLKIDPEKDKKLITTQVLNYGTKEATDQLFCIYTKKEIAKVIKHPRPGIWNKKSINYWSLKFNVRPGSLTRKIS